jgi:hypothetical protein
MKWAVRLLILSHSQSRWLSTSSCTASTPLLLRPQTLPPDSHGVLLSLLFFTSRPFLSFRFLPGTKYPRHWQLIVWQTTSTGDRLEVGFRTLVLTIPRINALIVALVALNATDIRESSMSLAFLAIGGGGSGVRGGGLPHGVYRIGQIPRDPLAGEKHSACSEPNRGSFCLHYTILSLTCIVVQMDSNTSRIPQTSENGGGGVAKHNDHIS